MEFDKSEIWIWSVVLTKGVLQIGDSESPNIAIKWGRDFENKIDRAKFLSFVYCTRVYCVRAHWITYNCEPSSKAAIIQRNQCKCAQSLKYPHAFPISHSWHPFMYTIFNSNNQKQRQNCWTEEVDLGVTEFWKERSVLEPQYKMLRQKKFGKDDWPSLSGGRILSELNTSAFKISENFHHPFSFVILRLNCKDFLCISDCQCSV